MNLSEGSTVSCGSRGLFRPAAGRVHGWRVTPHGARARKCRPRAHLFASQPDGLARLSEGRQRPGRGGEQVRATAALSHLCEIPSARAAPLLRMVRENPYGGHRRPLRPVGVPKAQRAGCPRGLRRRCSARRRSARHLLLRRSALGSDRRHGAWAPAEIAAALDSASICASSRSGDQDVSKRFAGVTGGKAPVRCDVGIPIWLAKPRAAIASVAATPTCAPVREIRRERRTTTGRCSSSSGAARSSSVNLRAASSKARQSAQRSRCAAIIFRSSWDSSPSSSRETCSQTRSHTTDARMAFTLPLTKETARS